jgi:S-methylmethionine-dependent homocysteine/selenocysteine methylase
MNVLPMILDGATGTELERRGVDCSLPLWSARALLTHPRVVEQLHAEYVEAGAGIIVANTFRANPRTLRGAGVHADGPRLNALAIRLARDAARSRPGIRIAASVAPVEDCYHPERVPDDSTLALEHAEMAQWLKAARPDLIWIETVNTIRETRIAAEAAVAVDVPFSVSFVLNEFGELLGGEPLDEAVAAVAPLKPFAVGMNCIPPTGVTRLLPRLRQLYHGRITVYAHINSPCLTPGWTIAEQVSPGEYADHAARWRELGADIIGGCCGTTPAHIRAVARRFGIAEETVKPRRMQRSND